MNNQILYFIAIIITIFSLQSYAEDITKEASNEASVNIMVIDINHAQTKDLLSLKGIGMKKAKAIMTYRQTNGPFTHVDDLLKVQGIGKHVLAENKSRLKI
jgi:competence protein ComEA